jgi:hypothetical protein
VRSFARVLSVAASLVCPAIAAAQVAAPPGPPAEAAPGTRAFDYSGYEEATLAGAFAQLGLERDPSPEGKIVEEIQTVRLEVIEERDPAPRLLNVFHVVTRAGVVEREVLLRPGSAYRQTLADETRRNLAGLPQLSVVLVAAARGSEPGTVRVVVVTKDVWSLRLNWNISLTSSGLESLDMHPSETNFLGTHQTVGLLLRWLPLSYSLGASYAVPRVLGSHVATTLDAGLIFARSGGREGSFADATVTSPLWSSTTEWAWGASASWLEEVSRLYTGTSLANFTFQGATVPYEYNTQVAAAGVFVTRSFGWAVKQDVSVGVDASHSRYTLPDEAGRDPAAVNAFQTTRVPTSEDRVAPFAQYRLYTSDFLRVLDLDTLALQEDYRLGPQARFRFYAVPRALGSSLGLLGFLAGGSYAVALRDGLASVSVDSTTEVATDTGAISQGTVSAALRLASPRMPLGRIVVDAVVVNRYEDQLNVLSSVGGDARLRGFPSQYRVGPRMLSANVEYRSRPWQILDSLQLGGVVFYDAGDAFDSWHDLQILQSAGLGARALFPQLDRIVFRLDVGFPLTRPLPPGVSPMSFVVTFGQAF